MSQKALVYGIRMFEAGELDEVPEAFVMTKEGKTTTITMHLIEGDLEQCRAQLLRSLDAFFEFQEPESH
ncbi:MAG: allantoinase [Acidobacteriia bacterium]|nr:allantoinase [Terriglobia bacterium]